MDTSLDDEYIEKARSGVESAIKNVDHILHRRTWDGINGWTDPALPNAGEILEKLLEVLELFVTKDESDVSS